MTFALSHTLFFLARRRSRKGKGGRAFNTDKIVKRQRMQVDRLEKRERGREEQKEGGESDPEEEEEEQEVEAMDVGEEAEKKKEEGGVPRKKPRPKSRPAPLFLADPETGDIGLWKKNPKPKGDLIPMAKSGLCTMAWDYSSGTWEEPDPFSKTQEPHPCGKMSIAAAKAWKAAKKARKSRCGRCLGCTSKDCGSCRACRMTAQGAEGELCEERKCFGVTEDMEVLSEGKEEAGGEGAGEAGEEAGGEGEEAAGVLPELDDEDRMSLADTSDDEGEDPGPAGGDHVWVSRDGGRALVAEQDKEGGGEAEAGGAEAGEAEAGGAEAGSDDSDSDDDDADDEGVVLLGGAASAVTTRLPRDRFKHGL